MLARFKQTLHRYPSSSDGDSVARGRDSSSVLLASPKGSPTGLTPRGLSALRAAAPWADHDPVSSQIQGVSMLRVDDKRTASSNDQDDADTSIRPFMSEDATAAALAAEESPRAASPSSPHGGPRSHSAHAWASPAPQPPTPARPAVKAPEASKASSTRSLSEAEPSGSGRRPPQASFARQGSSSGPRGLPPPHPATAAGLQLRAASSGSASFHEAEAERASSAASSTPPGSQMKMLPLAHVKKLTLTERVHMEESVSLSRCSVKPFQSEQETAAILAEESPGPDGDRLPAPWGEERIAAHGSDGSASAGAAGRGGSVTRAWTLPASRGPSGLQAGDSGRFGDVAAAAGGGSGKLGLQAGEGGAAEAGATSLQAGDSSRFGAGLRHLSKSFRAAQLREQPPAGVEGGAPGAAPASGRRRPKSATLAGVGAASGAMVGVLHSLLRRASLGGSSKVVPARAASSSGRGSAGGAPPASILQG